MAVEAQDMTARLRRRVPGAMRGGQLVAYFQPEFDLSSGRVVAAESLARWEHPEFGTLSPDVFAPVAEELGLTGEFTCLMLRLSLAQSRTWAAIGWNIPVSVNVGPDGVADPGFPAAVAALLRSEQVPGRLLTLEISEQTGTSAVSLGFFAQLNEFGVQVSLDDFGTGLASLESLGNWPIDELKLDISLVRPIVGNSNFRAIVGTTIDLAHQLGVKVVAEGVESEAVRSELAGPSDATSPRASSSDGRCPPTSSRSGCVTGTSGRTGGAGQDLRPRRRRRPPRKAPACRRTARTSGSRVRPGAP